MMLRTIYVAGVNRKHIAAAADNVPFWLLSATLLRKYPGWLSVFLSRRKVIWDPGTFSADAMAYHHYRDYLDRYAKGDDEYLQYDEIGDAEATAWYLKDMRRRGYRPIPVLQPGASFELLQEPRLALGGLVPMNAAFRRHYLDELLYSRPVPARIHLLGMWRTEWFEPYSQVVSGDSTTWLPRGEYNRSKTQAQWLEGYGEQWVPFRPRTVIQQTIL